MSGRISFDPTINLGHIVSAGVFLITASGAWFAMDARVSTAERDVKSLHLKDVEQVRDHKEAVVSVENRLMSRINEERARLDQTQVRVADDIREIKTVIRDGFRDLDAKLDRKQDKPGR